MSKHTGKFHVVSTRYSLQVTKPAFLRIDGRSSQAAKGERIDDILERLGCRDFEMNGHFGPYIFYTLYSDDVCAEIHAKIRQAVEDYASVGSRPSRRRKTPMATKPEGLPKKLERLGNTRANMAVHVCNGDSHPKNFRKGDKSENSRLWQADQDATDAELEALATELGFTVDYPGLYPVFRHKDGREFHIG